MLFATIEHSGTHRTIEVMNFSVCPLEERHLQRPGQVLFAHLYDHLMPAIMETARTMRTLTTFRPPADIEASWRSRGRDLNDLQRQFANYQALLRLRPYVLHLGSETCQ